MNNIAILLVLGLAVTAWGYNLDNCKYDKKQFYRAMGWCGHPHSNVYVGDFNGDKRDDIMCHDAHGRIWTSLAQADGSFVKTSWYSGGFRFCGFSEAPGSYHQFFVADFNGDGKSDILCHRSTDGYKWISLAKGPKGIFNKVDWHKAMGWCGHRGSELFVADFNGDKKADLLCHDRNSGYKWIAYTHGHVGFHTTNWHKNMGWCSHHGSRLYTGDFNGDGFADLMCSDNLGRKWITYNSKNPAHVYNNHHAPLNWHSNMNWCHEHGPLAFMRIADVNGDGKDDLICHSFHGNTWVAFAKQDPAHRFVRDNSAFRGHWCGLQERGFLVGKFNKDDRADIMCHHYGTGQKWILYGECPFVKK